MCVNLNWDLGWEWELGKPECGSGRSRDEGGDHELNF